MPISTTCRYRLASKARLVFDPTRAQPLLLYPERGLLLNEVAHAVVRMCTGTETVSEIVDALVARFPKAGAETVSRDVVDFLAELERRGLLTSGEAVAAEDHEHRRAR